MTDFFFKSILEVSALARGMPAFFLWLFLIGSIAEADISVHDSAGLALHYRVLANDYETSPETLRAVFISFTATQRPGLSLGELSQDTQFLNSMQKFSQSLNQLLSEQSDDTRKKNSLETVLAVLLDKYPLDSVAESQKIAEMYRDYLDTFSKLEKTVVPKLGIKINLNEVFRTVGTYGIWGFWFVTSTWGLVLFSPQASHFLYYPAVAMFLASGPFSISNQIWVQVFDQIERKAANRKQSIASYLKSRAIEAKQKWKIQAKPWAESLNKPLSKNSGYECLTYYSK